jgi:hypothetical protein
VVSEKMLDIHKVKQLVIAGWTGRDINAFEAHIRELEAIGVRRPKSTPIFLSRVRVIAHERRFDRSCWRTFERRG